MADLVSPYVYVLCDDDDGEYDIYSTLPGAVSAAVDYIEESFCGREDLFLHEAGQACGKPDKRAFILYLMAKPTRLHEYGMSIDNRVVRD